MTIDEAIVHAREVASRKFDDRVHCIRCAEEHEQLAEWLEELKQYRAIGTPEECRAAVEKQKAKKPIIKYKQTHDCVTEIEWKCPVCGTNYVELAPCGEWCRYCGTKFDWGDEE